MTVLLVWTILAQKIDPELTAAFDKFRSAERYAFKLETSVQNGESANSTVVEGRFEKDRPVWMKSGELEVYRQGDQLALLRNGDWRRVEGREGERRKRGQLTAAGLKAIRLPHEELASLLKQFKDVRKLDVKEGDQTVFLGEMAEEAARAYLDANASFDRRPEGPLTGTGRFWISASGEVAMVEIIVKVKGKKGREHGVSTWVTLSEIGTAKGEVPESALRALEEK
jgi:hypothetical protein